VYKRRRINGYVYGYHVDVSMGIKKNGHKKKRLSVVYDIQSFRR
jgi:hypothetical protein